MNRIKWIAAALLCQYSWGGFSAAEYAVLDPNGMYLGTYAPNGGSVFTSA